MIHTVLITYAVEIEVPVERCRNPYLEAVSKFNHAVPGHKDLMQSMAESIHKAGFKFSSFGKVSDVPSTRTSKIQSTGL